MPCPKREPHYILGLIAQKQDHEWEAISFGATLMGDADHVVFQCRYCGARYKDILTEAEMVEKGIKFFEYRLKDKD